MTAVPNRRGYMQGARPHTGLHDRTSAEPRCWQVGGAKVWRARTHDGVAGVELQGAPVAVARLEVVLRALAVPVPQPGARLGLRACRHELLSASRLPD